MSEVKIEFLENYKVDAADGPKFKSGKRYDVSPESARHFISRGVAMRASQAKPQGEGKGKKSGKPQGEGGGEDNG